MLITIKSPKEIVLCRVTVQPLSLVSQLIQKAITQIDVGLIEEGVYLRPCTWDCGFGLDPASRLPLILNEYTLDTMKKHLQFLSFENQVNSYKSATELGYISGAFKCYFPGEGCVRLVLVCVYVGAIVSIVCKTLNYY